VSSPMTIVTTFEATVSNLTSEKVHLPNRGNGEGDRALSDQGLFNRDNSLAIKTTTIDEPSLELVLKEALTVSLFG